MRKLQFLIYWFLVTITVFIPLESFAQTFKFRIYFSSEHKNSFSPALVKSVGDDVTQIMKSPGGFVEIDSNSYDRTVKELIKALDDMADVEKLTFVQGNKEVVIFKVPDPNLFKTLDLDASDIKALPVAKERIPVNLIIDDEYANPSAIRKLRADLSNMGYKVYASQRAYGEFHDYHYIQIFLSNNINAVTQALQKLSTLKPIRSVNYNTNPEYEPYINRYRVTIKPTFDRGQFIKNMLYNDIEVYRLDPSVNSMWIHFPMPDYRNEVKLKQISKMDGVIFIENVYNPEDIYFNENQYVPLLTYKVPREKIQKSEDEKGLYRIAQEEAKRLSEAGFFVTNYEVTQDKGGELIPTIQYTYPKSKEAHFQHLLQQEMDLNCASLF